MDKLIAPQRSALYVLDTTTRRPTHVAARDVSDYFLAVYEEVGRDRDPVLHHVLRHRTAIDSDSLMSRRAWLDAAYYREVLRLHRVNVALQAPLLSGADLLGTLNVGDVRRFDAGDIALIGALGRLAGSMLQAIIGQNTALRERDQLRTALELSDQAIIVTDHHHARRRTNAAARAVLDAIDGADEPAFLEDLLSGTAPRDGSVMRVPVALVSGDPSELHVRSVRCDDRSVVLTYLRLEAPAKLALPAHLASALSPRERQVTDLAIRGFHDAEIADQLYLSKHTVKEYLRNAYQKLSISSRLELLSLVASRPTDAATSDVAHMTCLRYASPVD